MRLSLIVAIAANGVIGNKGDLPWPRLSADLQHFKRTTMGAPVIMGRRTFESIGRALPGRRNIVVTRDATRRFAGCETAGSLDDALAKVGDVAETFVIGGAALFEEALPRADRLVLTRVQQAYEGDVSFQPDLTSWREVSRSDVAAADGVPALTFLDYAH
ncbi:dihydrofolate reductase [Roseiterribacter gracilis]|uniref:Dihydrofolate reductase n=1 Tax=Roseiterribacter gracilis TaxID=2812848 RepID=A0A8S8XIJ1_9PROT|nr:dihydrofolate reductase [Rhodospirillales bacterium TMPK1]